TLPVAQYAAVWSKNYRIKKAASLLVASCSTSHRESGQ
ncbi:hypothetical protein ACUOA8_16335, partial [Escherichia sp. SS-MK2]